ncbi:hypothetical protein EII10_12810, partial [Actinomyces bowdenii]
PGSGRTARRAPRCTTGPASSSATGSPSPRRSKVLDNSGDHVRATHHGDPHLDASGHSYGSVVNGLALQQTDVADELEVHGSPGTGSADASDMGLLPDHMAEASAAKDTVAFSGAHGRPPQ